MGLLSVERTPYNRTARPAHHPTALDIAKRLSNLTRLPVKQGMIGVPAGQQRNVKGVGTPRRDRI